ncbi:MAG TPA: leucyl/phenylalanyl-tRNA--protein transferase [Acidimicrobiales bacterium]|nr:leucyl/phenylalanyl-tRNA--protein transferase [Acidimicrobiales bacterium]
MRPTVPPPTPWAFPRGAAEIAAAAGDDELVAAGADLRPGTLLEAYRSGLFPMPLRRQLMGWWSPDPRGIIPLDGLRVSRSLRRSLRCYRVTVDAAFEEVIAACADRRREGAWIDGELRAAYAELHRLGWAHSVEAWDGDVLAGGLYGVAIGALFAGESMFHRRTDASKVALVHLVHRLRAGGGQLLDVQWATDHLRSLGAVEVSREEYHRRLAGAVAAPQLMLDGGEGDP